MKCFRTKHLRLHWSAMQIKWLVLIVVVRGGGGNVCVCVFKCVFFSFLKTILN